MHVNVFVEIFRGDLRPCFLNLIVEKDSSNYVVAFNMTEKFVGRGLRRKKKFLRSLVNEIFPQVLFDSFTCFGTRLQKKFHSSTFYFSSDRRQQTKYRNMYVCVSSLRVCVIFR